MYAPGEQGFIKACDVFLKIIEGQPENVRAELWTMFIQDLRAWRTFWGGTAEKVEVVANTVQELFKPKPQTPK
jgi:hypothetical protein